MTEEQLEALETAVRRFFGAAGYGLYSAPNQARADDVLVRERSAAALAAAADAVGRLRGRYQEEVVPPSTAENPFPPPEIMRRTRSLQSLQQSLSALGSSIRAQPTPLQDAIWSRLREETATLQQLLESDLTLVGGAEALRDRLLDLTPQAWDESVASAAEADLGKLRATLRDRERLLQI